MKLLTLSSRERSRSNVTLMTTMAIEIAYFKSKGKINIQFDFNDTVNNEITYFTSKRKITIQFDFNDYRGK